MNKFSFRKPANKFWRAHNQPGNGCHLGNPLMEITTRERGEIPGCTPAPEEHIYRPVSLEQAQAENALRADRFNKALDGDQFGPSFRGKDFAEPLFGAYGDKI